MNTEPPPARPPMALDRRTLTDHRGPPHTHDRHVVLMPLTAEGALAWRPDGFPVQ